MILNKEWSVLPPGRFARTASFESTGHLSTGVRILILNLISLITIPVVLKFISPHGLTLQVICQKEQLRKVIGARTLAINLLKKC